MVMEKPTNNIGANLLILKPISNGRNQSDRLKAGMDRQRDFATRKDGLLEAMRRGQSFRRDDCRALGFLSDQLWIQSGKWE